MTFLEMNDERKAHWYFHPWFQELLRVFYLDIAGTTPSNFSLYESIISDYHKFLDAHPRPEKPLISGHEVMEILGISSGAEVGRILHLLQDAQVRKEITTKKEAREMVMKLKRG
jgi:hypothetical protein